MRMRSLLIVLAVLVVGCSSEQGPPLTVTDIELTEPMPGRSMSAGYLVFENSGRESVRITSVTSPQYGMVEMHETRLEDGVSRMRKLPELVVEPGDSVRFERGGKHLMLMRPNEDLSTVTLNFYSDDTLVLATTVRRD